MRLPAQWQAQMQVLLRITVYLKPWEKGMLKEIEKAIVEANLGLSPSSDGELVRVPIPPLTEERRKEFVKQAKTKCEDAKVSVRNVRRDANDLAKQAAKDGDITEDDEKRCLQNIQELTDAHVKQVDELFKQKEAEIMELLMHCALYVGVGRLAAVLDMTEDLPTGFDLPFGQHNNVTPTSGDPVVVR